MTHIPQGSWLTETENGFMEPKYKKRFVSVMKDTLCSSAENMTRKMPRVSWCLNSNMFPNKPVDDFISERIVSEIFFPEFCVAHFRAF